MRQLIDSSACGCLGLQCPTVTVHLTNVRCSAYTWLNINKVTAGQRHLETSQLREEALSSAPHMRKAGDQATSRNINRKDSKTVEARSAPKNLELCRHNLWPENWQPKSYEGFCTLRVLGVFIFYKTLFSGLIKAKQRGSTAARHSCV